MFANYVIPSNRHKQGLNFFNFFLNKTCDFNRSLIFNARSKVHRRWEPAQLTRATNQLATGQRIRFPLQLNIIVRSIKLLQTFVHSATLARRKTTAHQATENNPQTKNKDADDADGTQANSQLTIQFCLLTSLQFHGVCWRHPIPPIPSHNETEVNNATHYQRRC